MAAAGAQGLQDRLTKKEGKRYSGVSVSSPAKKDPVLTSSKRKKWRVTDPAEIAPSYYHEDLFTASFPLVDVIKAEAGEPFPVNDKFAGVMLDPSVTSETRKVWCKRMVDVSFHYKRPETEEQAIAFHLALIEQIGMFTRPPKHLVDGVKSSRAGLKRKWDLCVEDDAQEDECLAGLSIDPKIEDVPSVLRHGGPSPRNRGNPETSATLQEHEDIPTGFAGSVIRVHDYRPRKRAKTPDEAIGKTERVAAILERKFAEDASMHRAVWQGGYHAAKYAESNIRNGHGTPLSILVLTSHSWTYGLLVPEGYVQLRNGAIDPGCEAAFSRHQQLTAPGRKSTLESLSDKLAKATAFYRKNFRDNPEACYRDGPQLVGKLYVRDEWFALPNTEDGGFAHQGAQRLFEGLLRLVLGDSVLNMSLDDLAHRVDLNQQLKSLLINSVC